MEAFSFTITKHSIQFFKTQKCPSNPSNPYRHELTSPSCPVRGGGTFLLIRLHFHSFILVTNGFWALFFEVLAGFFWVLENGSGGYSQRVLEAPIW